MSNTTTTTGEGNRRLKGRSKVEGLAGWFVRIVEGLDMEKVVALLSITTNVTGKAPAADQ